MDKTHESASSATSGRNKRCVIYNARVCFVQVVSQWSHFQGSFTHENRCLLKPIDEVIYVGHFFQQIFFKFAQSDLRKSLFIWTRKDTTSFPVHVLRYDKLFDYALAVWYIVGVNDFA